MHAGAGITGGPVCGQISAITSRTSDIARLVFSLPEIIPVTLSLVLSIHDQLRKISKCPGGVSCHWRYRDLLARLRVAVASAYIDPMTATRRRASKSR